MVSYSGIFRTPSRCAGGCDGALDTTRGGPGLPATMYEDMPPLEGQEDSEEGDEDEVETQGAVCTVAPEPKGRGRR